MAVYTRETKGLCITQVFGAVNRSMNPFFSFVVALFVTLVLIPPLSRVSGFLALQDMPGARKIHAEPIPCVGGFGIVAGVFLSILVLLPLEAYVQVYLIAACLIFIFGVWDDTRNLNYKWKFAAQAVPVAVALQGGFLMEHLPFFGLDPVSPWISYPITALFLLGLTNAVNLFDGLDGLAGGCMLLTLGAIAFLDQMAGGSEIIVISLATMGAILSFLYFNTYPARVFLGDAGSQFLGFTVGALAILLTQRAHMALNPALPLLLLGLPILDTAWVLILRIWQGRSPFIGDRQHLHYRILNFGFTHSGAVAVIYVVQAVMVATGILLMYQGDLLVVSAFLLECLVFAGFVLCASLLGWQWRPFELGRNHGLRGPQFLVPLILTRVHAAASTFMTTFIELALCLFLVAGALNSGHLSHDFSLLALIVAGLMLFSAFLARASTLLVTRIGVYVCGLLALTAFHTLTEEMAVVDWAIDAFFLILAVLVAISIRTARAELFQVTPQDLLVMLFAISLPSLPVEIFNHFPIGYFFIRAVILFYACEYLVSMASHRYIRLRIATFASLVIVGAHGWFL